MQTNAKSKEAQIQREHVQILAQIRRTERWLDDCCRPICTAMRSIGWSRQDMLMAVSAELDQSYPDVVQELKGFAQQYFSVAEENVWTARGSGVVYDYRADREKQITERFGPHASRAQTVLGVAVMLADAVHCAPYPLSREAPVSILKVVEAEPTSAIARCYRRWARFALVPLLKFVVQTLDNHSATM
eukprot:SAG31_NODE_795_length_12036_cov_28.879953_6_plen_188_part_00